MVAVQGVQSRIFAAYKAELEENTTLAVREMQAKARTSTLSGEQVRDVNLGIGRLLDRRA